MVYSNCEGLYAKIYFPQFGCVKKSELLCDVFFFFAQIWIIPITCKPFSPFPPHHTTCNKNLEQPQKNIFVFVVFVSKKKDIIDVARTARVTCKNKKWNQKIIAEEYYFAKHFLFTFVLPKKKGQQKTYCFFWFLHIIHVNIFSYLP